MKKLKKEKKKVGRGLIFVVCIFLITTSFSSYVISHTETPNLKIETNTEKSSISTDKLTYTINFIEPALTEVNIQDNSFTNIELAGTYSIGEIPGTAAFQVTPVQLLIPKGKQVTNINIFTETVEIETDLYNIDLQQNPIIPYQPPVPIGEKPSDFVIDYNAYTSNEPVPSQLFTNQGVGYCRGYAILTLNLYPTQYIAGEGRLLYHKTMQIEVDIEETGYVNQFLRPDNVDDNRWVESLVANPYVIETYGESSTLGNRFFYDGGLCDPGDNGGLGYDYVIITRAALYDFTETYTWDDLLARKEADGLEATKVKVEDILACPEYWSSDPLFNDTPAKIREFCRDAYQDWGTEYILVGGDQDGPNAIQRRLLDYEYESDCESDLYWSNLDNTFNDDHDSNWGEKYDSGFDLYSEIYIGSIPCDEGSDVSNWLTKSFYYADEWDHEYLDNAAFYGGDTGWSCQGDDFVDYSAIKGTDDWLGPNPHNDGLFPVWAGFQYGFETWNSENPGMEYDLSVKWTAEPPNPGGWMGGSESAAIAGFREAISNDECTLISAIAHANAYMSMDVYDSSWESQYHNTKPFFLTDYGCHCGDMDAADDGVLHSMLFHSDTELAFACVYNSGYGWGNLGSTNSSSAFQQKSFWDFMFDITNHSGDPMNWQMGKAHAWSKDFMAPTIDWDPGYGTWRGIIESCLLFGDPAQRIKPSVLPDHNLRVSTLGVPDNVIPDELIYVNTVLINNGQHDESDVYVSFRIDGSEVDSTTIPLFESRTTEQISFPWTPTVGVYEVSINVSVPGVVEDYYHDNELSKLVISGPDIATVRIDAPPIASISSHQSVRVEGTIENLGITDENVIVYLKINETTEDSQTFFLPVGSTHEVLFTWIPSKVGCYPVELYAEVIGLPEPYVDNNHMMRLVTVCVAKGKIMVVDDDRIFGEPESHYETYFTDALGGSEYLYDIWSRYYQGRPKVSTMLEYSAVVWLTGDDETWTLQPGDQRRIEEYLDSGGSIFISGQNIGYNIGTTDFYQNYLHAQYLVDSTNTHRLTGVNGDPIGDGLAIDIATGDGANNQDRPSGIAPLGEATEVFTYDEAPYTGGIKVDTGVYRVVYFAFGFEGINDLYDRNEIMSRIMDWLIQPELSYYPTSHDFGDMNKGSTGDTNFEIWNSGERLLEYTLSESDDWITVSPTFGDSTGEYDTITVGIDTTEIPPGLNHGEVYIPSNGGGGMFTITVNVPGDSFVRGDINSDEEVSMNDAVFILQYLYVPGSPEPSCMDSADVNDDGIFTMGDATYLLQHLYVPGSPAPLAPFPDCGPDPTWDDDLDCESHSCMG